MKKSQVDSAVLQSLFPTKQELQSDRGKTSWVTSRHRGRNIDISYLARATVSSTTHKMLFSGNTPTQELRMPGCTSDGYKKTGDLDDGEEHSSKGRQ